MFPAGWLAAAHRAADPCDGLSGRQLEVLELLGQGLPNATIAKRLFISKNTVKFHVAAIYPGGSGSRTAWRRPRRSPPSAPTRDPLPIGVGSDCP